jgi:hypothetical protein
MSAHLPSVISSLWFIDILHSTGKTMADQSLTPEARRQLSFRRSATIHKKETMLRGAAAAGRRPTRSIATQLRKRDPHAAMTKKPRISCGANNHGLFVGTMPFRRD